MFVNKIVGRKLGPAYFARKILHVEIFHCQKPFVSLGPVFRNIHRYWIDMSSGTEKIAVLY